MPDNEITMTVKPLDLRRAISCLGDEIRELRVAIVEAEGLGHGRVAEGLTNFQQQMEGSLGNLIAQVPTDHPDFEWLTRDALDILAGLR